MAAAWLQSHTNSAYDSDLSAERHRRENGPVGWSAMMQRLPATVDFQIRRQNEPYEGWLTAYIRLSPQKRDAMK